MSLDSAEAFVKQLCNDADFAKKITSKIDKDNARILAQFEVNTKDMRNDIAIPLIRHQIQCTEAMML